MIDPNDVQVMFADLQPSLVASSRTTEPAALVRSAAVLAEVASILGLPMIFSIVRVDGLEPETIPELSAYASEETTFVRAPVSPFLDDPTVAALARSGRRTLVIAGFAMEAVIVHAALSALAAGYHVQLPLDAIGGLSDRTEHAALRQMEQAGCMPTSVFTLTSMLAPDFSEPPGSMTFAALQVLR